MHKKSMYYMISLIGKKYRIGDSVETETIWGRIGGQADSS